jgi:hypothetical protein
MSSEFGARRRSAPRKSLRIWAVILMGVSLMIAVVAAVLVKNRDQKLAEARAWTVAGRACPVLTAEAFAAARLAAPKMFEYDGVTFGRAAGHVDCNEIGAKGGSALGVTIVCQFTSPAALTVQTPKGRFHYNPGIGKPVSVMVDKGEPRCVLGGHFKL